MMRNIKLSIDPHQVERQLRVKQAFPLPEKDKLNPGMIHFEN